MGVEEYCLWIIAWVTRSKIYSWKKKELVKLWKRRRTTCSKTLLATSLIIIGDHPIARFWKHSLYWSQIQNICRSNVSFSSQHLNSEIKLILLAIYHRHILDSVWVIPQSFRRCSRYQLRHSHQCNDKALSDRPKKEISNEGFSNRILSSILCKVMGSKFCLGLISYKWNISQSS